MTINHTNFVGLDGSRAEVQKFFRQKEDWMKVCELASNWLIGELETSYLEKKLVALLSDSSTIENNRITQYKRIKKREHVLEYVDNGCKLLSSGNINIKDKLFIYDIITISENYLPEIIYNFGSYRQNFFFLANSTFFEQKTINKFMDLFGLLISNNIDNNGYNEFGRIDNTLLVNWLIEQNVLPIRIWNEPDDRGLSIEIYLTKQFYSPLHLH